MRISEIRKEFLSQHDAIRRLIAEARQEIDRLRAGAKGAGARLRALAARLFTAVEEHNRREEALLARVLPGVDAWGKVRALHMTEDHRAEHDECVRALREAADSRDDVALATCVGEIADELIAHMAREEAEVLAANVLTDDVVASDTFGG